MVDHVSPLLDIKRVFNQLIISACLVIDIASVSLAQECLVRKLEEKYLLVALPLASYTQVLIACHRIFSLLQTGKTL